MECLLCASCIWRCPFLLVRRVWLMLYITQWRCGISLLYTARTPGKCAQIIYHVSQLCPDFERAGYTGIRGKWISDSIYSYRVYHENSWWRHQMETFPRYWPFIREINVSSVDSPHKDQWFDWRLLVKGGTATNPMINPFIRTLFLLNPEYSDEPGMGITGLFSGFVNLRPVLSPHPWPVTYHDHIRHKS